MIIAQTMIMNNNFREVCCGVKKDVTEQKDAELQCRMHGIVKFLNNSNTFFALKLCMQVH